MTTNFNLTTGKNRALVCYCATDDGATMRDAIKTVFESLNIEIEPFIDGGGETVWTIANVIKFTFPEPQSALNIALQWGETSRNLKVGGSFSDVCVGVFFYDAPIPPEPEIVFIPTDELGNPIGEPEYSEPEPAPSITSLVCDALRDTFGGVYGASAFVVPDDITLYTLEVE